MNEQRNNKEERGMISDAKEGVRSDNNDTNRMDNFCGSCFLTVTERRRMILGFNGGGGFSSHVVHGMVW